MVPTIGVSTLGKFWKSIWVLVGWSKILTTYQNGSVRVKYFRVGTRRPSSVFSLAACTTLARRFAESNRSLLSASGLMWTRRWNQPYQVGGESTVRYRRVCLVRVPLYKLGW